MSLRPRFGDGGLLRLPSQVFLPEDDQDPAAPDRDGTEAEISGWLAEDRDSDPFERTDSGLLLAEELARIDIADRAVAATWVLGHGAFDLRETYAGEDWQPFLNPRLPDEDGFRDPIDGMVLMQQSVRWALLSLARLGEDPQTWVPEWTAVNLRGGSEMLRFHADETGKIRFRLSLELDDVPGVPTLLVPLRTGHEGMMALGFDEPWPGAHHSVTSTRSGHIELVRRLLEPHVRIAARFEVELPWPEDAYPVLVTERRRWRSVLSPVYLQLLEGLRRITEGQRGAAFCKECGEPFLTLDARRSSFCNDQHRFRFSQRARRTRVDLERAAKGALARSRTPATGGPAS